MECEQALDNRESSGSPHKCDIVLVNCQALTSEKRDIIASEYLSKGDRVNFLCATETWFRDDSSVTFEDYKLISSFNRKDFKSGGGVAVWGADHLVTETIDLSNYCIERHFEACGVKWNVCEDSRKIILIVCYRADRFCSLNILCEKLSEILDAVYRPNHEIVVMGDFNLDPERDKNEYKVLSDVLLSYNLVDVVVEPTRGDKILDHVFKKGGTSDVEDNCFSDHRSIFFNIGTHHLIDGGSTGSTVVYRRRYCPEAVDRFQKELQSEDWAEVYDGATIDEAYNSFHSVFAYHFERNFPLTKCYIKKNNE